MSIAALVAALSALGPSRAMALRFDCAKASTPTELALCADTRLWPLDNELGKAVRRELTGIPKSEPLFWLGSESGSVSVTTIAPRRL
jgi:uncharacterized protein YecT (DUF1311 family)